VISPSQRLLPDNTHHSQETDIHAPGGIRTHNLRRQPDAEIGNNKNKNNNNNSNNNNADYVNNLMRQQNTLYQIAQYWLQNNT